MTKSVSTYQNQQALDNTHFLQVAAYPVIIFSIEGETSSTAGTNYFIQLHGASPTAGMVPLWSKNCVAASATTQINGWSFVYPEPGLDTSTMTNPVGAVATAGANTLPVWIAISSTDATFTAVAAATQATVVFEEAYLEAQNQTITGDTSTGRDSLVVWTTNSAKRLTKYQVTNNNGGTATSGTVTSGTWYQIVTYVAGDDFTNIGAPVNASGTIFKATGTTPTTWSNGSTVNTVSWLMLFAYVPAASAVPIDEWPMVYGKTYTQQFSAGLTGGRMVMQSNPTTFAQVQGCYLYGSSTPQTFTATAATNWYMKAWNI